MRDLDTIGRLYETDKATVFTRTYAKPKAYTLHYARCFDPLRDDCIKLLEIGVGGGESVQMWLDYLPYAAVFGVDLVEKTNPWNTPGRGAHSRYTFLQGDQTDKTMWACFLADCGKDFDIIIDDGSHEPKGIITAFECLWPAVKPGGYYAIEDLGCGFTSPGYPSHLDWLRVQMEAVNQGLGDIDSVYFARELVILRKKPCITT